MGRYSGRTSFTVFDHQVITLLGRSLKRVPGDTTCHIAEIKLESTPEGFAAVAVRESGITPMPMYPPERPERGFRITIRSLRLPPDGERLLRIRFKDATDTYRLRYVEGKGLLFDEVDLQTASSVSVDATFFHRFTRLTQKEDEYVWRCNPITTSATKNGELLWLNDIAMKGRPKTMAVLDKVLFVRTSTDHSFYVLKETGEVVFHSDKLLSGKDPWADVLPLWQEEMARAKEERHRLQEVSEWRKGGEKPAWIEKKRGKRPKGHRIAFYKYIRAAALLEERRAIPLLIQCIPGGSTLQEGAAAVAALEKINGNAGPWNEAGHPGIFLGDDVIPMNRVWPKENNLAEQAKWREIFGVE